MFKYHMLLIKIWKRLKKGMKCFDIYRLKLISTS